MRKLVFTLLSVVFSTCSLLAQQPSGHVMKIETAYEVIGHLYRWYLDEVDVREATKAGNETIWVREVRPELDPDDNSRFAELLLPVVGVAVTLKKADYRIEEMDLTVKSDRFKIVRVSRVDLPADLEREWTPLKFEGPALRAYLFAQRGDVSFPDDALVERLRSAVRTQIEQHFEDSGKQIPEDVGTTHCAPLSSVANEIWVFWEAGRMLIQFTSDLNIADPKVWDQEKLQARIYDIDQQVVVSLQEVAGSNAYLTRDQVGRALYNCVVLGRVYGLARPSTEDGE